MQDLTPLFSCVIFGALPVGYCALRGLGPLAQRKKSVRGEPVEPQVITKGSDPFSFPVGLKFISGFSWQSPFS